MLHSAKRSLKVGVFLVVSAFIFAIGLLIVGEQSKFFEEKYTLFTRFQQISGLLIGAPVRLAGVDVGTVTEIGFPTALEEKNVIATLQIDISMQNRIREDSRAIIQTMGLLGDKYVEITLGSTDKPIIGARHFLETREPLEITSLVNRGGEMMQNVNGLLENLNAVVTGIREGKGLAGMVLTADTEKYENIVNNMSTMVDSLNDVLDSVQKGEGSLGILLNDPKMAVDMFALAKEARGIIAKLDSSEGTIGALINDPSLYKQIKNDFSRLTTNLSDVLDSVNKGEGLLGALLHDASKKNILDDAKIAVAELRTATEKLNSPEGTIGALLNEREIYDKINMILTGAEKSKIVGWAVKHAQKKAAKSQKKEEK